MILFKDLKKGGIVITQNLTGFKYTIGLIRIYKVSVLGNEVRINNGPYLPANGSTFNSIYDINIIYFSCQEALIKKLESDLITIGETAGRIMDTLTELKNNI